MERHYFNGPNFHYIISISQKKLSKTLIIPKNRYTQEIYIDTNSEYFIHIYPVNDLGFDDKAEKETITISKYGSKYTIQFIDIQ